MTTRYLPVVTLTPTEVEAVLIWWGYYDGLIGDEVAAKLKLFLSHQHSEDQ